MPMLFAGLGYWGLAVPLGAVLAFPGGMGARGVWIGLALGLAVVAVLMTLRWGRHRRLGLAG
jgi:MATE family multidrug resistance protein